jgi:hypothetical protein
MPPKPDVELLPQLTNQSGSASLQGKVEEAAVYCTDPHPTAQFVVVSQPESRDPAGASAH